MNNTTNRKLLDDNSQTLEMTEIKRRLSRKLSVKTKEVDSPDTVTPALPPISDEAIKKGIETAPYFGVVHLISVNQLHSHFAKFDKESTL